MMTLDCLGLPVTTSSDEAVAHYSEGVERLLAGVGGSIIPLRAAVAADDGFAAAHAALAMALDEARDPASAAAHRQRAMALALARAPAATERERDHVTILSALAGGPDEAGMARAHEHLRRWPRDGLVLDTYQRHLFFHGGAGRRDKLVALFQELARAWEGHPFAWYADAKLALHLEEVGEVARARALAERAFTARKRNVSAVHALIHIAHAEGAASPRAHHEGARSLRTWLGEVDAELGAAGALLTTHLWWHVALAALTAGDDDVARALWQERVRPARSSGSRPLALADAVGLLWSWQALRPATCPSWDEAVALARQLAKGAVGRPFVDVHVATALLAVEDRAGLLELAAALAASPLPSARATSLPLVRAIGQILDEPAAALPALVSMAAVDSDAVGGSNVERALIVELALHAARRARVEVPPVIAAAAAASPHPLLGALAAHSGA